MSEYTMTRESLIWEITIRVADAEGNNLIYRPDRDSPAASYKREYVLGLIKEVAEAVDNKPFNERSEDFIREIAERESRARIPDEGV